MGTPTGISLPWPAGKITSSFFLTAILLMDGANIAGLMSGLPGWGFTSSQLYRKQCSGSLDET